MSNAGDIAAFLAAGASTATLGTSIYIARYQSRIARRMENVKWRRDRFTDDLVQAARAVRRLISETDRRPTSERWEDFRQALSILGSMEIFVSPPCNDAIKALGVALVPLLFPDEDYQRTVDEMSTEYNFSQEIADDIRRDIRPSLIRKASDANATFVTAIRSELGIDLD